MESLVAILGDGERSVKEMMEILDLSDRVNFLNLYLNPAKDLGVIEMTNPEKPKSPKQKYRLTERGRKKMG